MDILPKQPKNLILEARHTISLEVSKWRRLAVGSSLFLPRKLIRKMLPTSRSKTRARKDSPTNLAKRKRKIIDALNEGLQIQPVVKEKLKLQSREEPTPQANEKLKLQSNPESNYSATSFKHHNSPSCSPSSTKAIQNMYAQNDDSEPSGKPGSTVNILEQKEVLEAESNPSSKTNAPKKASEPSSSNPEGCTTNLFGQYEASEARDNRSPKISDSKKASDRSNGNPDSTHERPINSNSNINVEEQAPEVNSFSHTKQVQPARQNSNRLPFDIIVQKDGSVRILHDENIDVDLDVQSQPPPVENIFEMRNRNRARTQYLPIPSASYGGDPRYSRQPMAEFYPMAVPYYQGSYGNQYLPMYYKDATNSDDYFSPAIQYQQHYENIGEAVNPYYPLMHRQIPSQQSQYLQNCYPNIQAQRQNQHVQHFYINLRSPPFLNQHVQNSYPPPPEENQRAQSVHSNTQMPSPQNKYIQHSYPNVVSPLSLTQHDHNSNPRSQENQHVQDFSLVVDKPSTAQNQPVQNSHPNIQSTSSPNQHVQTSHPSIQAVHISKLLQPDQSQIQHAYFKSQQPQVPICDNIAGQNTHPTLEERVYQQLNLPRMSTQNQSVTQNIAEQHHIQQLRYQQSSLPQMHLHHQPMLQHTLNQQLKLSHLPNHLQEEIQRGNIRNMMRSAFEEESIQQRYALKKPAAKKTKQNKQNKQTKQQKTQPVQFQTDLRYPDSTTNENATPSMVTIPGNALGHPLLGDMAHILEQRRLFEFHQAIAKRPYNQPK